MEILLANLSGETRTEQRNGRDHLVVPMTMIVPGILNGSQGPLYYPLDEIQRSADAWNGIPLVVGHPTENGAPTSARKPSVLEKVQVGEVFNVKADGKLTAEGWFDVEKTDKVDSRILASLRIGKAVELSTGLHTDNQDEQGVTADGTTYTRVARNYQPDHLAILPDSIGACSVADGCGVLVNEDELTKLKTLLGISQNELSHDDLRDALNAKLQDRFGSSGSLDTPDNVWVIDVFQNKVIYSRGGKHFRLGFTRSNNVVKLRTSQPEMVQRVTQWKPVRNENAKEVTMTDAERKTAVDSLIANVCCWEEDDREVLNGLDEDHLTKLVANGEKQQAETNRHELATNELSKTHTQDEATGKWAIKTVKIPPTANAEPAQPPTREEWLEMAPPDVLENLEFASNEKQRQKDTLIVQLTANVADADKPAQAERLKDRSLADLQGDLALLPTKKTPLANWQGATGGAPAPTTNKPKFSPFGTPGQGDYDPAPVEA